ncbi:MAG: DUF3418 domain-containing protein, partial [Verrucomicrobiales bacterium]
IFILEALVNGETRSPLPALARNRETVSAAERLEHKLRRSGGLLHPNAVIAFYDERLPAGICTQKEFEKWASGLGSGALDLQLDDCIVPQSEPIVPEDFPDHLGSTDGKRQFELSYLHNPAEPADGIAVRIPLSELPHLPEWFGDWLVPGWLTEKVAALFRALDKDLRKLLPSNREVTEHFLEIWRGYAPRCSLPEAVLDFLGAEYGLQTGDHAFDHGRIAAHLSMRYEVTGTNGKVLGAGRDLGALQEKLAVEVQARFADIKEESRFEKSRLRRWSIGDLPDQVELDRHTTGFPGLHTSASLKLWPSAECATQQHRVGIAALYAIAEPDRVASLETMIFSGGQPRAKAQVPKAATRKPKSIKAADQFNSLAAAFGDLPGGTGSSPPQDSSPETRAPKQPDRPRHDLTGSEVLLLSQIGNDPRRNRSDLLTRIVIETLGSPRTEAGWDTAVRASVAGFGDKVAEICPTLSSILAVAESVSRLLDEHRPGYEESLEDARGHLDQLFAPGWLLHRDMGSQLLGLRGLELRLTRMFGSPPAKDLAKLERYHSAAAEIWALEAECACGECAVPLALQEQLAADENLRLKEFAPELRR